MMDRNRTLSNKKTKSETGFDFTIEKLEVLTPLGTLFKKKAEPFFPGEEELLEAELNKIEALIRLVKEDSERVDKLKTCLHCINDVTGSIARAGGTTLNIIDLYEIKGILLQMEAIRHLLEEKSLPDEFKLSDVEDVLDLLDPCKDRLNTFYIYNDYSEILSGYRERLKELNKEIRQVQKHDSKILKEESGIILTPKFDIVIPKSSDLLGKAKESPLLEQTGEDYTSVTFALAMTDDVVKLVEERETLQLSIEEEEYKVREVLSRKIGEKSDVLLDNCNKIGRLDYVLAKAYHALKNNCVRPIIVNEHRISIFDGRHLQAEDILRISGKEYMPISLDLEEGVLCITGANMGGKTVSLKLVGLIAFMTQYGMFVPCQKAEIGLSLNISILIGDSQSLERGLSSFGSEMEELKEVLENAGERSLILIDEIASGTNPREGQALSRSIVEYLVKKPYITMLTTHYEMVTNNPKCRIFQVKGLADTDFDSLKGQLEGASKEERLRIIGKHMDYHLIPLEEGREIPKDAISIAEMLGIPHEIIEGAKN